MAGSMGCRTSIRIHRVLIITVLTSIYSFIGCQSDLGRLYEGPARSAAETSVIHFANFSTLANWGSTAHISTAEQIETVAKGTTAHLSAGRHVEVLPGPYDFSFSYFASEGDRLVEYSRKESKTLDTNKSYIIIFHKSPPEWWIEEAPRDTAPDTFEGEHKKRMKEREEMLEALKSRRRIPM